MITAEHLVRRRRLIGELAVAVRHGVPDHDLGTLGDHPAPDRTGVVGGPLAAPAQGPHLQGLDPIRQLDQPTRAGEQQGPEVGQDPDGEDVDAELVDDPRELVDLLREVELGLVADQVVDPLTRGQLGDQVDARSRSPETPRRPGAPTPDGRRWWPPRRDPGW